MSLDGWTACEKPGQTVMVGADTVLEPLEWGVHLGGLFKAVAGPENSDIWAYMPIGPFEDKAQFRIGFTQVSARLGWETCVIKHGNTSEILGMASYMRIREAHGSAEVGCVAFGEHLKRTKHATEAMYLMASHIFDELGYRRYEWKCHNENTASKRAAERFGFQFEGIFRNDMVIDGKNRDTAWFAMTDEDWPDLKAAFESWLHPDNFDVHGHQKQRLEMFRSKRS